MRKGGGGVWENERKGRNRGGGRERVSVRERESE